MKLIATIDRYVFFKMAVPFFVSVLFCLSIFVMKYLLELTDMIVNHGADLYSVFLLLICATPYFLQYVVPMSVMVAVLITCLRMSEDNEIVALRISGISVYRLIRPVILFSVIGTVITSVITMYALPKTEKFLKALSHDICVSGIIMSLKERTFNDRFDNLTVYLGQLDVSNKCIRDVFIEDTRIDDIKNTVIAPRGQVLTDRNEMRIYLRLFDGIISRVNAGKKLVQRMEFDRYDICLDVTGILSRNQLCDTSVKEMNLFELKSLIRLSNTQGENYFKLLVQYYKIFAISFSCVPMGILALSVGVYNRRVGRSFAIGFSIILFLGYYFSFSVGLALGESGFFNPMICVWLPNISAGLLGLIFLARVANGRFIPIYFTKILSSKVTFLTETIKK